MKTVFTKSLTKRQWWDRLSERDKEIMKQLNDKFSITFVEAKV